MFLILCFLQYSVYDNPSLEILQTFWATYIHFFIEDSLPDFKNLRKVC
ncbi:hypothetical protein LBBP_04247 [Leptospira borgpetersenii serovar Ballum]|uniref:Uncharacterized protein n=1 Tax=Leptospira borgpetersenii serovar Ballum TaxID=280505 RepID=A0A0S2IXX7_LEPBO|nr:hypothetical protein LBBP_04247 [Leptospira borgpetersenii serovar Ballum]